MSSPYGAAQPPPQNVPPSAEYQIGVQPGISSAVVAAEFVIVYGPSGGLFVYSGTPALGNLVASISAMSGTDFFGNTYQNVASFGNTATGGHFRIDESGSIYLYNPAGDAVFFGWEGDGSFRFYGAGGVAAGNLIATISPVAGIDGDANPYPAGLGIEGAGAVTVFNAGGNEGVLINAGQNVFNYIDGNAGVTGEGAWGAKVSWRDWALVNGWGSGAGGPGARYSYLPTGTTAGSVMLSATLSPGTNTDGTLVGTIPAAYAPQSHIHTFPVATDHQSAVSNPYFQLDTSGNITCYGIANAATIVGVESTIPLAL